MKIIGQQLIDCGDSFGFGDGMGCSLSEGILEFAIWSGLGPHSMGGRAEPKRLREQDCIACGAGWFLPILARLKSDEKVSLEEIEQLHLQSLGKPMVSMNNEREIVSGFNSHMQAGKPPEEFFAACRIVRWEKDRNGWLEIFST